MPELDLGFPTRLVALSLSYLSLLIPFLALSLNWKNHGVWRAMRALETPESTLSRFGFEPSLSSTRPYAQYAMINGSRFEDFFEV